LRIAPSAARREPSPAGAGFLVLTRRGSESVMIGDDIEITVLEVAGAAVKIGISAPRAVKVLRSELA
jgi:carbon storage regulator CsrA